MQSYHIKSQRIKKTKQPQENKGQLSKALKANSMIKLTCISEIKAKSNSYLRFKAIKLRTKKKKHKTGLHATQSQQLQNKKPKNF